MIIYPDAFILSAEAAGESLRFPRICYSSYTLALDDTAVTASTQATGAPKDAPLRPDTGEYWQATASPATWEIDLGATRNVDYVGIAGHDIGTSAASVLVETSMGDLVGSPAVQSWTALGIEISPADNRALLFLDDVRTARFVRLTVTSADAMPKIAVVYIGEALVMPIEPEGSGFMPITLSRQTTLHRSLSSGGQFLGQNFRSNGLEGDISFIVLDPAWYRATFDPFVQSARTLPYFVAWWPEQYSEEVAYVWSPDDIVGQYMGQHDYMQVSWKMIGLGTN